MAVSVVVILASAALSATPRLVVWAGFARRLDRGHRAGRPEFPCRLGLTPTDSLVERYGLFTIIVLGEVVLGVVAGLSAAER